MSEEKRKVKSRKRHSSKMMRWLHTEGRRYCAIALCASLILGNIGQMAAAADGDPDKEFELDRVALYEAVQEAVLGDPVAEGAFEFSGDAASTYEKYMFEDNVSLYELKPEINDNKGDLKLRIFAKIGGEVVLDDDVSAASGATQLYEIDGSEEFYFLLTNTSSREQTAVIRVGEKETELITVVPNSAVVRTEPEGQVAAENLVDATALEEVGPGVTDETAATQDGTNVIVSGSTSNGDSTSGGGRNGSGGGTTTNKIENETVQETTEVVPEVTQPAETEAGKETQIAEKNEEAEESAAIEESEEAEETDAVETEEVKESEFAFETELSQESEAASKSEEITENEDASSTDKSEVSGAEQNSTTESENKSDSEGNADDTGNLDTGNQPDNNTTEEYGSDSTGDEADADSTSTGQGTADVSIENDTLSDEVSGTGSEVSIISDAATISFHKTYRVAESKATASNATPSDAEEEPASDSNATDSNAAKNALDGSIWEAVGLDDASAVMFATTAENIQVSSDLEKFASPSDAGHLYQASVDDLGITVQVYAKENSFSEKVDLSVTELKADDNETSEDFQKAKAALDDSGLEYTNMIALDVSFISRATGEEVEPENGKVQVYFELDASLVAEEAIETLAVHHLEEKGGDIVNVETVADNANPELSSVGINENELTLSTEFNVASFSSFTVTWKDLEKPNTVNEKDTVNFYVNLYSYIANSEEDGSSEAETENFTTSVYQTTVASYPDEFWISKELDQNNAVSGYVVIQGSTDGSAYDVDQDIRTLGTVNGYSDANAEGRSGSFILNGFPSDAEVFKKIKNDWNQVTKNKGIKINGVAIEKSNLTTDNYAIRWYVFKYNFSDAWHVDGILVPKYGRLEVNKTIETTSADLTSEVSTQLQETFNIKVSGTTSNDFKQNYTLTLSEDDEDQSTRGYDEKVVEDNKITYTWYIDVLETEYTIEENASIENWEYSAKYSKKVDSSSKDTSTTEDQVLNGSFKIKCVVAVNDSGTDVSQSVHLKNTYKKTHNDLLIKKTVDKVSEDAVKEKTFVFAVKADENTPALFDGTEYMVGDTSYTVLDNTLTVTITGTGSITIEDLPLGTYTVSEVVEGTELDLTDYYYAGNDGVKTVEVTGNATAETTITNTYEPWLKITVKKTVLGNMGDRSAEFTFKPEITRGDANITSQICADLEDTDGKFTLKDYNTSESEYKEYKITGLKRGDMVTIEEIDVEAGYTTTAEIYGDVGKFENKKYSTGADGIQSDTRVVFINEKEVITPTGLFTTKIPYMLMLAVAVLGIFGFTVADFRKRALKKREDD